MRRLILAWLGPIIEWATKGQRLHRAIMRDPTGAYEVFHCPCGLMMAHKFTLDDVRAERLTKLRFARAAAENHPPLAADDCEYA